LIIFCGIKFNFSHLSINRYDILYLNIYFWYLLEEWRNDIIRGNTVKVNVFSSYYDKDKKLIQFLSLNKRRTNKKETDNI